VQPPDRTGVLVIRAWLEADRDQLALRARVTRTVDVSAAEPTETVAASEREILAIVDAWLEAFREA
jgi:hypothetical protein